VTDATCYHVSGRHWIEETESDLLERIPYSSLRLADNELLVCRAIQMYAVGWIATIRIYGLGGFVYIRTFNRHSGRGVFHGPQASRSVRHACNRGPYRRSRLRRRR